MTYDLLLIFLSLAYAIISWRNFKLGLVLLAGLLPVYLLRFNIGPIPTTALEILILILVVVWILKLRDSKFRKGVWQYAPALQPWMKPIILLIAAACIGVTVAPDPFSALGIWKAYFIEPVLVAVMMLSCFDKKDFESALKALAISSIVLSIIGILQYLTGLGIPTPWDVELRITSIFDYPNALGLFLSPIVAMAIVRLSSYRRGVLQYAPTDVAIWIATALFGTIAIIMSQTEAALVAIPVALIITFLISPVGVWRAKPLRWRIGLESLGILIILIALIPTVREKIFLQDYSGQVRLSQWTETAEMLKDHFIFGAGLNGYPIVLKEYHDPTMYEIFQYPHNIFLNIWVELGLLGLVAFFWFSWLIFRALTTPAKVPEPSNSLQLALLAAFLVILIHGLVDVPYFKNDLAVMSWIFIAALIAQTQKRAPKT